MGADNKKSTNQSGIIDVGDDSKEITRSVENLPEKSKIKADSDQGKLNNADADNDKSGKKFDKKAKQRAKEILSRIKTSKTLQTNVESTKTLVDVQEQGQGFILAEKLPENQPPQVPEFAEHEKTEKLQKLEKYYLLKEVSRSPNGVVYKARHEDLHKRIVALKVMSNEGDSPYGDRISRFKQEINHISRLQHPNIVPVYDIGTTESWLYFTMAFVEGNSLAQMLKKKPLSVNYAVRIMIKVARGIHYANQRGIIHRDIKPSNILMDKNTGEPMIVDFGLAKDIKSDIKITQSGVTLGTPPYMPPEQARGKQELLDSRSDIYSLGATLYELITGKTPFEGETGMQILMKVLNNSPARPRKYNSSISPDLEAIIMKCLSKKQGDRYQNSLQLASDLKKYLSGDWVSARQNTPINRVLTRIYSYRYMIYSVLFAMLAISIFILSGYFRGEIDRRDVISTLTITDSDVVGQENRRFRILGIDESMNTLEHDLWLHDEIWINHTTAPFSQSFERNNYAGVILSQSIGSTDFKIEFNLEILPFEDESPNFSFFLLPDKNVPEIRPFADPVIKQGYLLTLGADDNIRWLIYRNGIAQTGDSSFILGAQSYYVKIQVNSGQFSIEVQDRFRQLFTLNFNDDYPLPLKRGGHFGFLSVNTPVVISSMKLSLISPATSELEKPDRLFNLGLYDEAMIDYQQKALFAWERKNYSLYYESKFKVILCARMKGSLSSEEVSAELEKFDELDANEKPAKYEFVYLQNLYEKREFKRFLDRLRSDLADEGLSSSEKQRIVYACCHLGENTFSAVYNYNLMLDFASGTLVFADTAEYKNLSFMDVTRGKFIEMLLLRRLIGRGLYLPEGEIDFGIALLKLIINSSIDDDYVKYWSKNMLFLAEIIKNHSHQKDSPRLEGKDFVKLILNRYFLESQKLQYHVFSDLINLLRTFDACKIEDFTTLLNEVNDFFSKIPMRKGYRYNYWLGEIKNCIEEIFSDNESTKDLQTQPEKAEVK